MLDIRAEWSAFIWCHFNNIWIHCISTLMDQDVILMKLNIKNIDLYNHHFSLLSFFILAFALKINIMASIAWNQIVWIILFFRFSLLARTTSQCQVAVWRMNKLSFDIKSSSIHWIIQTVMFLAVRYLSFVSHYRQMLNKNESKRNEINDVNIKSQMQPKVHA